LRLPHAVVYGAPTGCESLDAESYGRDPVQQTLRQASRQFANASFFLPQMVHIGESSATFIPTRLNASRRGVEEDLSGE
jgi:hypothetical protein